MELGMIELAGWAPIWCKRPQRAAHHCVVYDTKTEAVQALRAPLYERFSSRGEDDFADKLLSALRHQFDGHKEKAAVNPGNA